MKKLALIAIVIAAIALPTAARAGVNDYSDPEHPLFSDHAGFAHARGGNMTSITVVRKQWLAVGVNYWNKRAGWNVLVFTDDPNPEITADLDPQCRYCALATSSLTHQPSMYDPYESCNVSIAKDSHDEPREIAHELGHCLGLMHQHVSVMNPNCDRTKIKLEYAATDRTLLVNSGYAV